MHGISMAMAAQSRAEGVLSSGVVGRRLIRCDWAGTEPDYIRYHDEEWGVPVTDDRTLFEFLVLEGAQAGLSWLTILRKREGYRRAFAEFEPQRVARFNERKVLTLLGEPGIVRNRLKIESAVRNAKAFIKVQEEFGSFASYQWQFVSQRPVQNQFASIREIPAQSPLSDAMSKDLKKRGFNFVGSTIIYAHMQAVGMVNDHLTKCYRHAAIKKLGRKLVLPGHA